MDSGLIVFIFLCVVTLLTSCSNAPIDDVTVTELSKMPQDVVRIDELPPEVTNSEYIDPIANLELYPIADCNFTVEGNHVEAHYDDVIYVIDYNLNYYDYDVDQVSIFSADLSQHTPRIVDLPDGWQRARINDLLFFYDSDHDVSNSEERSYATTIVDTTAVCDIESSDVVNPLYDLLSSEVDIFPYALKYDYATDGTVSLSSLVEISNLLGSELLSENDCVTRYILREELAGLPISIQTTNNFLGDQYNLHFEDLYGSTLSDYITDSFNDDFYNIENTVFVDFVYTKLENIISDGEWYSVCPMAECLANSISPLIFESFPFQHIYVYHAELMYLPFADGYFDPPFMGDEINLVPVWTFYYFADDDGQIRDTGAVYINAISGEAVTRRMPVT